MGTIVEVGTISAYLSLSKKGFGPTFAKLTFREVELVQFRAMWALSEVNWAQTKKNKVGSIERGIGTTFDNVDTIGHPN